MILPDIILPIIPPASGVPFRLTSAASQACSIIGPRQTVNRRVIIREHGAAVIVHRRFGTKRVNAIRETGQRHPLAANQSGRPLVKHGGYDLFRGLRSDDHHVLRSLGRKVINLREDGLHRLGNGPQEVCPPALHGADHVIGQHAIGAQMTGGQLEEFLCRQVIVAV